MEDPLFCTIFAAGNFENAKNYYNAYGLDVWNREFVFSNGNCKSFATLHNFELVIQVGSKKIYPPTKF